MKKYRLIGKIVLSFIIDDEQQDWLLYPSDKAFLESNGTTVWYITEKGERIESITTANIIDTGLEKGSLEEIKDVPYSDPWTCPDCGNSVFNCRCQ